MLPLYCETPKLLAAFPAEPVNTWSNLIIIAVGIVAMMLVARRPKREGGKGLWFLAILLVLTGMGSFLWHGWRTEAFLLLDVLPGVLFLITLVYGWLRRFYSKWVSVCALLLFCFLEAFSGAYGEQILKPNLIFIAILPVVVVFAAWLIARTYQESVPAAWGGGALLLSVIAVFFRSIDLSVCASLPIGTHFLWHTLLSLAGLLGILTLIVIDYSRYFTSHQKLRMDVH